MDRSKNNQFIITLISIACFGVSLESYLMDWEFWVPPLIILGIIILWVMHIFDSPQESLREVVYFVYTALVIFYHGVHETSFFDITVIVLLSMVAFSFMERQMMINIFLLEFLFLFGMHIVMAYEEETVNFDPLTISRVILHIVSVVFAYYCLSRRIQQRLELLALDREKDARIEINEADMEDFLSNISHELRTPVNVVNGMSDLLIKKGAGDDALAIRQAGIRLQSQIEDIQDYTETKRKRLLLEEEEYMSTSLINDVVTSFKGNYKKADLELVVDLDPLVPSKMWGDIKKLHKIFRYLLDNAVKFTRKGGIYIKMYIMRNAGGVNLCIEVMDTGIGMTRNDLAHLAQGMYQVNKKRNRSVGGIGLGLFVVYGFVHKMGGFVKIESEKGKGTIVRVTVPQKVVDETPCIKPQGSSKGDILFHVRSEKYSVAGLRDFYRMMAVNLAAGIKVPLYQTETVKEIESLRERLDVRYIFMGQEEYEADAAYFDELSQGDMTVVVSAEEGFKPNAGSQVILMAKPIYAYPIIRILNDAESVKRMGIGEPVSKRVFTGVRALIVDDEPMNLVVATGLFKDYGMITETAGSGKEAIRKFRDNEYDIVFMDHMMPEMDGVEAMKQIKDVAAEQVKNAVVVALTANVVSGAREMFVQEGFDGFIAKPIDLAEFERVMLHVLPKSLTIRMEEAG